MIAALSGLSYGYANRQPKTIYQSDYAHPNPVLKLWEDEIIHPAYSYVGPKGFVPSGLPYQYGYKYRAKNVDEEYQFQQQQFIENAINLKKSIIQKYSEPHTKRKLSATTKFVRARRSASQNQTLVHSASMTARQPLTQPQPQPQSRPQRPQSAPMQRAQSARPFYGKPEPMKSTGRPPSGGWKVNSSFKNIIERPQYDHDPDTMAYYQHADMPTTNDFRALQNAWS